jgi:AcrR family transcriptional regulator
MRTHGWAGSAPATDEEAVERILIAASEAIDAAGASVKITDVARAVGVTRQTVYRYFESVDALLFAAAVHSASAFLDRVYEHVAGITEPDAALVEGIAFVLEALPEDKHMSLLLAPDRANALGPAVTSELAVQLAQPLLRRFDVDWAAHGFDDDEVDELAEFVLRILQSFVVDPGRPHRTGPDLRRFLDRWVGPALRTGR